MTRHPDVARLVAALVGTWKGTGEGGYPTLQDFKYREETVFLERPDHPALHYEQRAWRETDEGEVVSHWETGLLRISSDRTLILNNAQGGRTETMAGTWEPANSSWAIRLRSTGYAGDGRVVASTRSAVIKDDVLDYEMVMETTSTAEMSIHLRATLRRQSA